MTRNTYDDETYLPNNVVTYVEEFVKPTFRVTLADSRAETSSHSSTSPYANTDDTSTPREITQGDNVQIDVAPSYYFGGVMTDTV